MDVQAGALVIQYMRGGERITKEDYEKNRKVKNAKIKSNDDLVIQYMKGGEHVTKEDYQKNRKVKNAKKKSIGDDDQHKKENSNEILLQKKIADLEKALRDKEKQNTTLEENFQNKLKENKDFQLKLEKANGLNDELLKKIDQKDLKIETLEKQMESKMRHTKSSFKKKIKELREAHKDQLNSKDVTIAKLSQKLADKEQTSVKERKVKSLKNLHHKTPLDGKKETNREITRFKNQSSIPVCELHDNARLNSLETAVHLLKKQLCTQNNELAQLRNVCFALNNADKQISNKEQQQPSPKQVLSDFEQALAMDLPEDDGSDF